MAEYRENSMPIVTISRDGGIKVQRGTTTQLPGFRDIEIIQGSSWTLPVSVISPGQSTPMNLSTYTAQFIARAGAGGSAYISLTESAGITLATSGTNLTVALTAAQTAALSFTRAQYELNVTSASTVTIPVLSGNVDFNKTMLV